MKTIEIEFPKSCKRYKFNVNDPNAQLGVDYTIYLPEYQARVKITEIWPECKYYRYINTVTQVPSTCRETLHHVPIKTIWWTHVKPPQYNSVLTLKEAKVLYNQGGAAAKVACKFFSKEELIGCIPKRDLALWQINVNAAIRTLQKLANTLNDGWRKAHGNIGYFLSPRSDGEWDVRGHAAVYYPSLVYFKRADDAWTALKQLSPEERRALAGR